jgi:antitoxin VapB
MATARVFKSGNSQAVRLPKEFRLSSKEVEIFRRGDELVLREKPRGLERAFEILASLEMDVDAIEEARKERPQRRKGL